MGIEWNETSSKSMGGTELQARRLEKEMPPELMNEFQIILSRVRDLDQTKYRILWCHDLPEDPEAEKALTKDGWRNFHRLVFVSNWQMQGFINRFNIPWSKCVVMRNAIDPLPARPAPNNDGITRLIYTPTPHRGLNILAAVFNKLAETDQNIHLDVFSSFKIYGWEERDQQYEQVFEMLKQHPQVTYHGSQPNDVVREHLLKADIFAYPSIWPETSCICLIEAMSAGLQCVHSNLGALHETAANWTAMYQYHEDINAHASRFFLMLKEAITMHREGVSAHHHVQKDYVDAFYSWESRKLQWKMFLKSVLDSGEPRALAQPMFHYKS